MFFCFIYLLYKLPGNTSREGKLLCKGQFQARNLQHSCSMLNNMKMYYSVLTLVSLDVKQRGPYSSAALQTKQCLFLPCKPQFLAEVNCIIMSPCSSAVIQTHTIASPIRGLEALFPFISSKKKQQKKTTLNYICKIILQQNVFVLIFSFFYPSSFLFKPALLRRLREFVRIRSSPGNVLWMSPATLQFVYMFLFKL